MKFLSFFGLAGILLLVSCSSLKVTSDYDKDADFSQYKTYEYYGWAEESDKILNRFDKERIEQAFGAEFAKRGLKYVKGNGDLVVSLFVVVDQKTSTTAYTDHYGMGGYGYAAAQYGSLYSTASPDSGGQYSGGCEYCHSGA